MLFGPAATVPAWPECQSPLTSRRSQPSATEIACALARISTARRNSVADDPFINPSTPWATLARRFPLPLAPILCSRSTERTRGRPSPLTRPPSPPNLAALSVGSAFVFSIVQSYWFVPGSSESTPASTSPSPAAERHWRRIELLQPPRPLWALPCNHSELQLLPRFLLSTDLSRSCRSPLRPSSPPPSPLRTSRACALTHAHATGALWSARRVDSRLWLARSRVVPPSPWVPERRRRLPRRRAPFRPPHGLPRLLW